MIYYAFDAHKTKVKNLHGARYIFLGTIPYAYGHGKHLDVAKAVRDIYRANGINVDNFDNKDLYSSILDKLSDSKLI